MYNVGDDIFLTHPEQTTRKAKMKRKTDAIFSTKETRSLISHKRRERHLSTRVKRGNKHALKRKKVNSARKAQTHANPDD